MAAAKEAQSTWMVWPMTRAACNAEGRDASRQKLRNKNWLENAIAANCLCERLGAVMFLMMDAMVGLGKDTENEKPNLPHRDTEGGEQSGIARMENVDYIKDRFETHKATYR
jgi:hypothetical protein